MYNKTAVLLLLTLTFFAATASATDNGGTISGVVTAGDTGQPLPNIWVSACSYTGSYYCSAALTDTSGNYSVAGLPPDTYHVSASGSDAYAGEYYNDTYGWVSASPVAVALGSISEGINFSLARAGSISGRITDDDTGGALVDVPASACPYESGQCRSASTDAAGNYTIAGLPPVACQVWTQGRDNYIGEFYYDTHEPYAALPVSVISGADTGGINFSLELGGSISGVIVSDDTGLPLPGASVNACTYQDYSYCFGAMTDDDGSYIISGLQAGPYRLHANGNDGRLGEYYDNTFDWASAAAVSVTAGQTTDRIDFGLARGGSISGRVVADDTGQPVEGLNLSACMDNEDRTFCVTPFPFAHVTDADGNYTITGLMPGLYRVNVNGNSAYAGEYYDNTCDWNAASAVAVAAGLDTLGINFSLDKSETLYCDDDGDGHMSGVIYSGEICRTGCMTQPGDDCNDHDALIYPGSSEGPDGDPTCGDALDNDCDGATDAADPGCRIPPVTVTLVPDDGIVPRGGVLGYKAGFTNNSSSERTFMFWTYMTLPNGDRFPAAGELSRPVAVTLSAGQSRRFHLTHNIPAMARAGSYTYHCNAGPYPVVWETDSFQFTVTLAPE
ncbi:MAG: carboxypeptidase regulatory-like domain-containing protein [Nitrospirae bacterium]|nr:carboxypeptidase regulatory-like domain-containing protein [Nitrospirota bacterium]